MSAAGPDWIAQESYGLLRGRSPPSGVHLFGHSPFRSQATDLRAGPPGRGDKGNASQVPERTRR